MKFALNYRGERAEIWRGFLFDRLQRFTNHLAVQTSAGPILVSTRDSVLGRITFQQKGFEEHLMRLAVARLRDMGIFLEGTCFVDVGANIGTSTVQALAEFGFDSAVALEPSPENCRLLRINLVLNGFVDKVRVVEAAASDKSGTVRLGLSPTNSGDHRVVVSKSSGEFREESWETTAVKAVTLQSLGIENAGIVWMDIQGFEVRALAGAGPLLKVPLVVEYWPYAIDRAGDLEEFHRLISEQYGSAFDLRTGERIGPADLKDLSERYRFGQTDLLLVP